MTRRSAMAIGAGLFFAIVMFRTLFTGWSPPTEVPGSMATLIGLTAYPADNLSYVSWAEQARQGHWLFEILYTTTEHGRLFFNPLFLAAGGLAATLGVSPLLVLNVLATLALPVVVVAMAAMGRRLGLGQTTTFAAICLALGGAGISWVRQIVAHVGVDGLLIGPVGPDLSFYDVFPLVAYFVAPYHAISLAILAVLVALILRAEDMRHPLRAPVVAGLVLLGLCVSTVRPHTAIMVLGAYAVAVFATVAVGAARGLRSRRLAVLASLIGAMGPGVAYAVWVSRQPVWSAYAAMHRPDTFDWVAGFFFLWLSGVVGAHTLGLRRIVETPFAFLASWALGAGVLLLVLNGAIYPKLTYGFTIALALVAGAGLDHYRKALSAPVVRGAVAVIALLSVASPLLMLRQFARATGTTVDSELIGAIRTIHDDQGAPLPTVLTDCGTGVVLPALGGARVFCGHWALTDGNRARIMLLERIGFTAESDTLSSFSNVSETDVASMASSFETQLEGDTFDYLLVRREYRIFEHLRSQSDCVLRVGERYVLMRMCPAIKAVLRSAVAEVEQHAAPTSLAQS